jgi:hypothetical protein
VQSQTGSTTRKRDQDSHAQNSQVRRPSIFEPSPQSNWSHIPGSGIQGRYVRRLPALHAAFAAFTARRVERGLPRYPIFTSRSWATSARIFAFEVSTQSSIFSRNASIAFGRGACS